MANTRDLARKAIDSGLFGPSCLTEPEHLPVPEKYRLVRRLGGGGSGDVFLADDTDLKRPVALKFLRETRPAVLERFRREARFTARLKSPSIVQVFELGEIEGQPYLAMEYIEGGNLAETELNHRQLVSVSRDITKALRHAHENGIVHRDIKPGNILVDKQQRPYLTDFGIARNLYTNQEGTLSEEGQVLGTPASMPPEQARGRLHAVDARSDVYSLGSTLFYKLTGRWPFEADNVVDLLHAVIHDAPPMPRSLNPTIPRSLEAVVLKCLRKDRRDRYQSMEELETELTQLLDSQEIAAESNVWFRKLVHRISGRAPEPAPMPESDDDPYLSVGMEAAKEIARWDADVYRVSRNIPRAYPRLDALIDRLQRFLSTRPDSSWARFYLGQALFRRGLLDRALDEMEQAISGAEHLPGAYFEMGRVYLAIHLRTVREAHKHLSKVGTQYHLEEAPDRLEQAVLAFQEAARLDSDMPAWQIHYADAVARLSENDLEGCVKVCKEILEEEPDAEEVWKLQGDTLRLLGRDPFESYERALEIRRGYLDAWMSRAEAYVEARDFAQARKALEDARAVHPDCAEVKLLRARIPLLDTEVSCSEDELAQAIALCHEVLESDPKHYEAAVTLSELLVQKGMLQKSKESIQEAWAAIQSAKNCDGCQNRVNLLEARVRLARAKLSRLAGQDPLPDLEAILAYRNTAPTNVPDNHPWSELLRSAEEEKTKSSPS